MEALKGWAPRQPNRIHACEQQIESYCLLGGSLVTPYTGWAEEQRMERRSTCRLEQHVHE